MTETPPPPKPKRKTKESYESIKPSLPPTAKGTLAVLEKIVPILSLAAGVLLLIYGTGQARDAGLVLLGVGGGTARGLAR